MTTVINTRQHSRRVAPARYRRRRPWWLGAPDRELVALVQYVGHRTRISLASTAIFALIYLGANGWQLG